MATRRKAIDLRAAKAPSSFQVISISPLRPISTVHHTDLGRPRTWDFSEFDCLGDFGIVIAEEFNIWMDSYACNSSSQKLTAVRHFLRFITREDLSNVDIKSARYWISTLKRWRTHLSKNRNLVGSSKSSYFGEVQGFVGHLQAAAAIPRFTIPRNLKTHSVSGRKKTLAEVAVRDDDPDDLTDLPEIVKFDSDAAAYGKRCVTLPVTKSFASA